MEIHVSPRHKVVGVPASPGVLNLFPQARVVTYAGNPTALLPHGAKETRLLRQLGLDVPAPVLSQYAFPDAMGWKPFDVQRKTVAMMTLNQRGYVLNGMGTGKSKCALWAFHALREQGLACRLLVVAPLSTLRFTWAREVFQTLPELSVCVLRGTREKRKKLLAEPHDVYVVNHDGLALIEADLAARRDIDTMVIDECRVYGNDTAKRSKIARRVVERMTWAWGMTGSPTPQSPMDAFGQCRLLTPDTVPARMTHFRDQVMTKVTTFKWAPRKDAKEVVERAMQPAVRFSLDDVIELPEVIERTIDVDMGPRQATIYETMREHALAMVERQEITAVNAGAVASKLLQISLGYVYAKDGTTARLDNEARLDALLNAIRETPGKTIVFAPFTNALDGIMEFLEGQGIDAARVDGGVPAGQRDKIFAAFQNTSKYDVLAAHPECMAHGLTLTRADTIVWFGPITKLEIFEQANARIRRIGQKAKQLILMLQGTAAEKKAYANLRTKQAFQSNLLEMFAANTSSTNY